MKWTLEYINEAKKDLKKLDGSVRTVVVRAIEKVSQNPLPREDGGYGKSLRNSGGRDLANFCKIKLKASGIRVVYKVERVKKSMRVIIIGMRSDLKVYDEAVLRIRKYGL